MATSVALTLASAGGHGWPCLSLACPNGLALNGTLPNLKGLGVLALGSMTGDGSNPTGIPALRVFPSGTRQWEADATLPLLATVGSLGWPIRKGVALGHLALGVQLECDASVG